MGFKKGKTKTYILTAILMIVVSIFAFGLAHVSKAKDVPTVFAKVSPEFDYEDGSGSGTGTGTDTETDSGTDYISATFQLSDDVTLTVNASIQDVSDRSTQLDFYNKTLGWSISAKPGATGTTWYLPRTTTYNSGLPTLRQFETWHTVSCVVQVKDNNDENIGSLTVGSVTVPESINSTTKNNFYDYKFNDISSNCAFSDSNSYSDYVASTTYSVDNNSFICKIKLKPETDWPKKYKVNYYLKNQAGEDIDENKFKWTNSEEIITKNYSMLSVSTIFVDDCSTTGNVTLSVCTTQCKSITNGISVGKYGYRFTLSQIIVKIGETQVFDSSTNQYNTNIHVTNCADITVTAYICPRYKIEFEPTSNPSVTWNDDAGELVCPLVVKEGTQIVEVTSNGYPTQWKITDAYDVEHTCSFTLNDADNYVYTGVQYVLADGSTPTCGEDDVAYTANMNSTIKLQFEKLTDDSDESVRLPDLNFKITGVSGDGTTNNGADWEGALQGDTIKAQTFKYYVSLGTEITNAGDYATTQQAEFTFNAFKNGDKKAYIVALSLWQGYSLKAVTIEATNSKDNTTQTLSDNENFTFKRYDSVTITAEVELINYDFALGYTIKNEAKADNDNARYLDSPYEENGVEYLDVVKNIASQINVLNYTALPTSDDLKTFLGNDYEPLASEASFNCWLLDIDAIKQYGDFEFKDVDENATKWVVWVKDGAGNDTTQPRYWVEFVIEGNVVTAFNGKQFIKVTQVRGFGGGTADTSPNLFDKSNVPSNTVGGQTMFNMIVVPSWSMKYNVEIDNSKSKWSAKDSDNSLYGISKNGTKVEANEGVIKVGFSLKTNTEMSFAYSSKDTAFTKSDDIKSTSNLSLTFKDDDNKKYTIYNYGFDVTGYTISFKCKGQTYYIFVDYGNWDKTTDTKTVNVTDLFTADGNNVTIVKDLKSLLNAINTWAMGDYTFASTVITIQPVWSPVKIQLTGDFDGETKDVKYFSNYKLSAGDNAAAGKSIAYYKTGDSIVVCDDGNGSNLPWMYTNITTYEYNKDNTNENGIFDFDNLYYSLALTKYEVDNIYKVKLINTENAKLNENGVGTDYVGGTIENSKDVYYYTEWITCRYSDQDESNTDIYKNKPTENYANEFKGQVDNFENGMINYNYTNENNAHKYYLRTIYSDSQGNKFVYLANDHLIGDLRLIKDYYKLISWRYNGADGKCNFTTKDYDGSIEGQKAVVNTNVEEDNIFACGANNWTINCDDSATSGALYLSAIYYREQYILDVNTVANGFEGFYGYIQLELVDNGNAENNASYLIKFNDAGGLDMYKYIGTNAQNTAGSDVPKLRSSGWNLVNGEKSIVIYPGCEVKLKAYDQSQVTDMAIDSDYYDEMIGYRFAGKLAVGLTAGKGTLTTGQVEDINGYNLVLDTVDKIVENNTQTILLKARYNDSMKTELVKLYDNDNIKADLIFEQIDYSTTVEMLLNSSAVTNTGNIVITNNITNANGSYKSYNLKLKRGSKFSIYYHAFAGYGLQTPAFSLNEYTGAMLKTKTELSSLDMDGTPALVGNDQTYILNMSGAWLRKFYYRNSTSYNVSQQQNLGNLAINVEYISFSVKYAVYETDDYITPILNGDIVYDWTLLDILNWTIPCEVLYESGQLVTYYMLINGNKYAVLNTWGYQPRAVSEHTLLKEQYDFALKQNPVYNKQIDTDTLYSMVVTSAGVIVPEANRTFTIVVEVSPIYEITMQIEPGKLMGAVAEDQPNDTNCTERSMTITNGVDNNNTKTLTVVSASGSCVIYTHKGLSNAVSAKWDDKYYSGVSFSSNLGEEISSSFTVNGDCTIYANFIPTTLPLKVNYYYQNEGKYLTEGQAKAFITDLQLTITRGELCGVTNSADSSQVVANDTITLSYTLGNFYYLNVLVNGAGGRMNSSNKIKVSTADYEASEVSLILVFSDRKKGQINLEILPDNSNGAVFHNEDFQALETFANLYISGTNNGKQGSFLEGLRVEIKLGTIPNGYRFVGVKQNYGDVNTAWRPVGSTITITDGVCPTDLTNDEFVNQIAGTYYVLFQKLLVNTKMELVTDNLDNYTYSINGNQAVKDVDSLVLSAGSCSVNDTITLVRKSDLANEALIEFYYVNNGAEISIATTSPATLKIDEALITSLSGKFTDNNKTITLKVRNIRKYNITFTVSEGAQYLNEILVDNTKLDGNTTFVSQYINVGTKTNVKISSILEDKFTIAISGDATATADEIDTSVTINANLSIDVKITKNTFALSTSESLYADIVELNNQTSHQLTGENVVNKNAGKSYLFNTEVKLDFLTNATTEGEKVQLTELHFADELLTFTFNLDWAGELANTVEVADKDGNALSNVDVSNVGNAIQITYTLNGQQYVYKIQQINSGAQLSFMGQGNATLNLTYTAIKLIDNTTI